MMVVLFPFLSLNHFSKGEKDGRLQHFYAIRFYSEKEKKDREHVYFFDYCKGRRRRRTEESIIPRLLFASSLLIPVNASPRGRGEGGVGAFSIFWGGGEKERVGNLFNPQKGGGRARPGSGGAGEDGRGAKHFPFRSWCQKKGGDDSVLHEEKKTKIQVDSHLPRTKGGEGHSCSSPYIEPYTRKKKMRINIPTKSITRGENGLRKNQERKQGFYTM